MTILILAVSSQTHIKGREHNLKPHELVEIQGLCQKESVVKQAHEMELNDDEWGSEDLIWRYVLESKQIKCLPLENVHS